MATMSSVARSTLARAMRNLLKFFADLAESASSLATIVQYNRCCPGLTQGNLRKPPTGLSHRPGGTHSFRFCGRSDNSCVVSWSNGTGVSSKSPLLSDAESGFIVFKGRNVGVRELLMTISSTSPTSATPASFRSTQRRYADHHRSLKFESLATTLSPPLAAFAERAPATAATPISRGSADTLVPTPARPHPPLIRRLRRRGHWLWCISAVVEVRFDIVKYAHRLVNRDASGSEGAQKFANGALHRSVNGAKDHGGGSSLFAPSPAEAKVVTADNQLGI
ncbi:hypothetical protein R3P38DRAFT_3193839 [Favolaschia claudopus]|uniref:Uncharacterized protein n=1 Tax=Favolaschia claudopus TaxID=2862362 RepID=A0AAW0BFM1_9AGAR